MKSKLFRKLAGLFALLMIVTLFSSCNRGIGCPSAFKAVSDVITVVK